MLRPTAYSWALLLLPLACATADIRPETIKTPASEPQRVTKGRQLLKQAADAQGGLASFLAQKHVEVVLTDTWPSWLSRKAAGPWSEEVQELKLEMALGSDNIRLTMLNGDDAGTVWGLQNWVTYRAEVGQEATFDAVDAPNGDVKFWVPTTAYFPFAIFRLQNAQIVEYAGTIKIGEKNYERVYVTWGSREAQDAIDQYLLFIDAETHLLTWMQYTIRDYFGFMVGQMKMSDYRQEGPLLLPHSLNVVGEVGDEEMGLHGYGLKSIKYDPQMPTSRFLPRPDLQASK